MSVNDKKDYLKKQIQDYLENKHGLNVQKNFKCLNPAHDDKNPSMSLNKQAYNVKCFSCGETYDIFDLIGLDYNINDFMGQLNKACEIYGIEQVIYNQNQQVRPQAMGKSKVKPIEAKPDNFNYKKYLDKARANIDDCTYLEDRGISKELTAKYGIGYDPNFNISTGGQEWQAVIIPTSTNSFIARNIKADTESKFKVRAKGKRIPFNLEALKQNDRPIYIVEGEIDALSVLEVGGIAIGLGGDNNQARLVEAIKKSGNQAPLIVAFDNDKSGQEQGQNLLSKLKEMGAPAYMLNPYGNYNDPNDYLIADRQAFKESIESQEQVISEVYQLELEKIRNDYIGTNSVSSYIQDFINGIGDGVNTSYVPTGFLNFDKLLDGGLYAGLYVVGAISSLGKTTLVMQAADQIAQLGQDVLIFSLEMARYELMSKSISRQTYLIAKENKIDTRNAKTARGITTARNYQKYNRTEKDLIKKATEKYSNYANNLFISEGIGDIGVKEIKEIVERHIKITGNRPVIVIDYLQILAPYDIRATDKQNTDKAVLELKRLSRDYKIPVLAISSLNRNSYSQEISMSAFKESGAIEYGSDVLIGLQLVTGDEKRTEKAIDKASAKDIRRIQAKILKNRNGRPRTSQEFDFYTLFNYFKESDN